MKESGIAPTSLQEYLVGIPIPSLDNRGESLSDEERALWAKRTLEELTECFGGATPVPAPGVNIVQGPDGGMLTLYEEGQTVVLSLCDDRREFLRKRSRIGAFAERVADALRQEAVLVLTCPSDSFLVEGVVSSARSESGNEVVHDQASAVRRRRPRRGPAKTRR